MCIQVGQGGSRARQRSVGLGARRGDVDQGGVGLCAPRRVPGERRGEVDRLACGTLGQGQQVVASRFAPQPRRLDRQAGERLAATRRHALLDRQLHGARQVPAHPLRIPRRCGQASAPHLQPPRLQRGRRRGRRLRRPSDPGLRLVGGAQLELCQGHPARGKELDGPLTERTRLAIRLLATREAEDPGHRTRWRRHGRHREAGARPWSARSRSPASSRVP